MVAVCAQTSCHEPLPATARQPRVRVHPWSNDLHKLNATVLLSSTTELKANVLVQVAHERAPSFRQLSVLPFFRRASSPADTRLGSASHEDFCNRHTLKNPPPVIPIPFLLHPRVRRYPRIFLCQMTWGSARQARFLDTLDAVEYLKRVNQHFAGDSVELATLLRRFRTWIEIER